MLLDNDQNPYIDLIDPARADVSPLYHFSKIANNHTHRPDPSPGTFHLCASMAGKISSGGSGSKGNLAD